MSSVAIVLAVATAWPAAQQPADPATAPGPAGPAVTTQDPAAPAPPTAPAAAGELPVPAEFVQKVRAAVLLDYEMQKDYTYVEKRRDVKVSRLGKVTVGPVRTFEVYPSTERGKTYKRLVAIDGKPLDPADLERRDNEHRQGMVNRIEQEKRETPAQRTERLKKQAEERREREAIMDDAFAVYAPTVARREILDGHPTVVASLKPRADAKTKTREGKWMKKFEGHIWVSESDYQIAKVDMVALGDLTLGLGLIGRVHEGSRLSFTRRKVNNEVWLPAEARMEATGRALLFRTFKFDTITTYSDYRKWSVDTSITYGVPPAPKPQE